MNLRENLLYKYKPDMSEHMLLSNNFVWIKIDKNEIKVLNWLFEPEALHNSFDTDTFQPKLI